MKVLTLIFVLLGVNAHASNEMCGISLLVKKINNNLSQIKQNSKTITKTITKTLLIISKLKYCITTHISNIMANPEGEYDLLATHLYLMETSHRLRYLQIYLEKIWLRCEKIPKSSK